MDDDARRALLDEQDWGDIHARLRDFARDRCNRGARGAHAKDLDALAKDLAQEAIARVFGYESKWEPEKDPDLVKYLMSVVNSLLANQRSSAAGRRNVSMSKEEARDDAENVADERALPEAVTVEMDLFTRRLSLLSERLADAPQALRVLELEMEGVSTPREIRERTGWTADAVMAARRRMMRAAALVARDLGGDVTEDSPPASAIENDADTTEDVEVA